MLHRESIIEDCDIRTAILFCHSTDTWTRIMDISDSIPVSIYRRIREGTAIVVDHRAEHLREFPSSQDIFGVNLLISSEREDTERDSLFRIPLPSTIHISDFDLFHIARVSTLTPESRSIEKCLHGCHTCHRITSTERRL